MTKKFTPINYEGMLEQTVTIGEALPPIHLACISHFSRMNRPIDVEYGSNRLQPTPSRCAQAV